MASSSAACTWITGASSGIGAALAVEMSRRGAVLALSARRPDALERVRRRCARPDAHAVVPLDLADPPSLAAAAETVRARFGAVDTLVHNGGVSQRALAEATDVAVVRRLFEVNFFGAVGLTQAVLPSMLARGRGRIGVVSSLVGKFATPQRSAYAASKHALHGYFDALRAEVAGRGVGVTMLCPGFIRTDVTRNALTADGTPQGTMDAAQARGMDPATCARQMADALAAGRAEVYIGGRETWGVYLHRLWPALFRRLIRRVPVT